MYSNLISSISLVFLLFIANTLKGQNSIEWLSIEEAIKMQELEPKKIVIDLYTDWCVWCGKMDEATFRKEHIAKYINENYYPVKFNGEYRHEVKINGQSYKYIKNGTRGYHELAVALTKGRLSYPTVVFLDEDFKIIQPIAGFKSSMEFEKIMTYFGSNSHKNIPWSTYQNNYVPIRVQKKRMIFTGN